MLKINCRLNLPFPPASKTHAIQIYVLIRWPQMQMTSLAATPAAFLLPSRSTHVTAGKLALISMLFTAFFLFTSGYHFPGGASHFPNWALAIAHGTTLPPSHAQRDVGFPLLYILGGFPIWQSFIGITLIQAAFAVLMPVLVYFSLARVSPTIAFYMGSVCIISLSPYTYMKFFYHDQAYMFFNLLTVALLVEFLWSHRFRTLIFFTLSALAASFTRTAGNLMYPVLATISYVAVRGPIRHYLAAILIFALGVGVYQWHRYEIFDMRNQPSIPSGTGMQTFYGTYQYTGDFGVQLSPDFGPNTKHLLEELRKQLQPNVRESELIKRALPDDPPEFMEQHVYAYTPDELVEKIIKEPNEEYYYILLSVDPNDQLYTKVAWEIARARPWYIVQYTARNLWHALFAPGYSGSRYNVLGYHYHGLEFIPGSQGWGVRSEDPVTQYGPHAAREMQYFPLKDKPPLIQQIFAVVEKLWLKYFGTYALITSALIMVAWLGAFLGAVCWAIPHTRFCRALMSAGINKLMAPIIAVSALLLYEDLATSMFSQPNHRYFHMTEPYRLVIAGFGLAIVTSLLSIVWPTRFAAIGASPTQPKRESVVSTIQRYDLLDGYFGRRPAQWICLLVIVNVALFAWWTFSTIAQTWDAPPIEIVSATYGQSCQAPAANLVRDGNVTNYVKKACEAEGNRWCTVFVDNTAWGDPAPGCEKDFSVSWRCQPDEPQRSASIAAPAGGKSVDIDCNGRPPSPPRRE
jgi:hypothetical protein